MVDFFAKYDDLATKASDFGSILDPTFDESSSILL